MENDSAYCVKADMSTYASAFQNNGYAATGWEDKSLSEMTSAQGIYEQVMQAEILRAVKREVSRINKVKDVPLPKNE